MRKTASLLAITLALHTQAFAEISDPALQFEQMLSAPASSVVVPGQSLLCGASQKIQPGNILHSFEFKETAVTTAGTKEGCEQKAEDKKLLYNLCVKHLEWFHQVPRNIKELLSKAQSSCEAKVASQTTFSCAPGISVNGERCDERRTSYSYHCQPYKDVTCDLNEAEEMRISLKSEGKATCEEVRATHSESVTWWLNVRCEFIADIHYHYKGEYGCTACPTN